MLARLDHWLEKILSLFCLLALPVIGLLFLQWPLRDLLQAGSREANDLGQCLFALYIAASITMATRRNAHLKSDLLAHHISSAGRIFFQKAGQALALLPWAAFLIWAAWPAVVLAFAQQERFAETGNGGYFLIKGALMLMAALVIVQGVLDLAGTQRIHRSQP